MADGDPWRAVLEEDTRAPLTARVATMRLRPTARSLIRYRGEAAVTERPPRPAARRWRARRERAPLTRLGPLAQNSEHRDVYESRPRSTERGEESP